MNNMNNNSIVVPNNTITNNNIFDKKTNSEFEVVKNSTKNTKDIKPITVLPPPKFNKNKK
jgi:hypothetical protein